ncbi:hypothetical protein HAL07_09530 [Helicobacter ailurogastricus]|uniref:Uncharacterized protein n=1 Tax=Helicobacter ailurogastricus TaxID=1578720 RepID=A0A0K2Y0N6_9HELI|nr:hypothetical protein HAL07_09530 [Helicobacter ailurogastricus]
MLSNCQNTKDNKATTGIEMINIILLCSFQPLNKRNEDS